MKILNIYRDFKNYEPYYEKWHKEQTLREIREQSAVAKKPVTNEVLYEQKRAKILTDALTTLDEYAQTKAEDIDSVSQTLLYMTVGTLGAVGTLLGECLAQMSKNQKLAKTLPSAMGVGFAFATFLPVVRSTVFNQVRANRIARFDGIQGDKLFHQNNFAVLTDEQQKKAKDEAKNISDSVIQKNTIISRANIFNSMSVFREFTMKQGEFAYLKNQHDKQISEDLSKLKTIKFSDDEIKQSQKDQKLFRKILRKVDIESQYPLERIEKAVNVSYSSLFAGGVLEYIASDGILNLLNVKHKVIRPVLSWGLPIITIMSLNKQLANFLNDAVKAVRYKKMQEFINNPDNFKDASEEEISKVQVSDKPKEEKGFIEFFKGVLKDIEDYQNYQNSKRIDEKKFSIAVRNLKLTQKQKDDAELLRRNAKMVINTLDDQLQKYASATETITESTTIPLDIIAPIMGTFVADKLHKTIAPQKHFGLLFKGIGALLAFLPAAMSEIYFVGRQRQAKRCAILIANNEINNNEKFLNPAKKENKIQNTLVKWNFNANKSNTFMSFKKFSEKKD